MQCPHCGNGVTTGDTFCRYCGKRVTRMSFDEQRAYGRRAVGRINLILIVLAMTFVAGGYIARRVSAPDSNQPVTSAVPVPAVTSSTAQPVSSAQQPGSAAAATSAAPPTLPERPAKAAPVPPLPATAAKGRAASGSAPAGSSRQAVRVGGNIKAPTKVKDVRPVYPQTAIQARVQGVVIIEATVAPTGEIADAKILRSVPLLDEPALEAVRQWMYAPTLLNGVPVPVIMTVTVQFTLK